MDGQIDKISEDAFVLEGQVLHEPADFDFLPAGVVGVVVANGHKVEDEVADFLLGGMGVGVFGFGLHFRNDFMDGVTGGDIFKRRAVLQNVELVAPVLM